MLALAAGHPDPDKRERLEHMSETNPPPGGSSRTLATGATIPQLGIGVWQVPDGRECENAVRWALECGYRLIDTAQASFP